ncbi:hypothetical protein BDD43_0508 [Mucilaginibacter gracilis]|uniref:Uncharacterized protein n=1 Tax=Mucilaginibacter gracilis TaxID=423350 RepID=A0A495IV04_9SPHI|nr:hypothetical protein [Mucilaginibacter gracilis]RKR80402.1 hypothetical protein BDD43_0508 [Mucilaginibacter gracilis]
MALEGSLKNIWKRITSFLYYGKESKPADDSRLIWVSTSLTWNDDLPVWNDAYSNHMRSLHDSYFTEHLF